MTLQNVTHKRALLIGAHPDDIEIGCGGACALLAEKGYLITSLIISSGEQGGFCQDVGILKSKRENESLRSAEILGVNDVIFFRQPDGLTFFSLELKVRLIALIRNIRPEIIFTHAKSDQFPDHKVVCELTESAVVAAGGPWYSEAGSSHHVVKNLYGYEVWNPINKYQMVLDISSVAAKKFESVRCHYSQTAELDYIDAVEGLARYRGAISMAGKYAEVFEVLRSEANFASKDTPF